ncbi:MAG: MOSC N-terminal beta barrel domain-containing protein, partial [Mycobacteriaceae bacterium]
MKSLQGEALTDAGVEPDGLSGDRGWGIRDETSGRVLTARRAPGLLYASATLTADGTPILTLPTGETCHGPGVETDKGLSRWLGKPVSLVSSAQVPSGRAEFFADATDDSSEAIEWTMPTGRFVDSLPLLVLTTASLRT